MNNLNTLDEYRQRTYEIRRMYGNYGDHTCGVFEVPSPIDQRPLNVIASSGGGWDHVSVSRKGRCPNWPEMDKVKSLFFKKSETAVQYHVPTEEHVNNHSTCLHLWRCHEDFPRPPMAMVGIKGLELA